MKCNNWQCKLFSRRKRKYNSYKGQVGKIAYNILNGDFTANKFGQKKLLLTLVNLDMAMKI